jgi:lauroyl/myristoyl acyltransferase
VNILSSTGRVEDDVALMKQAIEQLVKTKPEQYLWNYKRFKGIIRDRVDLLEHWYYFDTEIRVVNILSSTGRVEDDVALMNQAIEQLVKTKPEQYLWNYKRFKGIIRY